MASMSEATATRRDQVVQAAIGVFLRYGYARTTMADLAQAAGLSRPTLYLEFPDKDAIFHAVVDAMVADKLTQIRQGLPGYRGFQAKLRFACETWGAEGFELVQAHPDAKDMFDLGFASVCNGMSAFGDLLTDIIRPPLAESGLAISPTDLAQTIVFAIKGFKEIARDGADMRRLIGVQVAIVSAALGRKG
jgi:AcrR family transcriptional regulator